MNAKNPTGIYLCGPISNLSTDSISDWRCAVADVAKVRWQDGVEIVSPLRGKNFGTGKGVRYSPDSIVTRDLADIDRCQIVLVNLEHVNDQSCGSYMEMFYAFEMGKAVITVIPLNSAVHQGVPLWEHTPYWIVRNSTEMHESMAEAIKSIEGFWLA